MEINIIKDKYNAEIALLILCCRVFLKTADNDQLAAYIKAHNIDWQKVYDLSTIHRIRPVIFKVLFPVKELVPEDACRLFHSFCMNFSSRAFSRKAECDRIIGGLAQQGIHARQYKGLDFSALIYKDIGMRECVDIDIIIAEKDLPKVVGMMKREGYEMHMNAFYERFPVQFTRLYKDVCFYKKGPFGGTYSFEFHFRPTKAMMHVSTSFRKLLGSDYLSPDRRLSYNDYYKLMIINNGLSDYYPTLRSLLDLAFITSDKREDTAVKGLKRFNILRSVLSVHLFNTPGSILNHDRRLNKTSKYLLHELLTKKSEKENLMRNTMLGLNFLSDIKDKWNSITRSVGFILTPNGNDIASIKLPFYGLYYFTKPFRLIGNSFIRLFH